ncbi:hypothetical protein OSB04_005576 [Centaurea solstitialis]|uniref:Uncharacterized protein n=1 Tax=Centaurea solstitialis TaxID=347529 RepID=A0AA38TU72_9ASTR|nr:hypothetical protein OSB04_005576 [Centaurea solstitialis]
MLVFAAPSGVGCDVKPCKTVEVRLTGLRAATDSAAARRLSAESLRLTEGCSAEWSSYFRGFDSIERQHVIWIYTDPTPNISASTPTASGVYSWEPLAEGPAIVIKHIIMVTTRRGNSTGSEEPDLRDLIGSEVNEMLQQLLHGLFAQMKD